MKRPFFRRINIEELKKSERARKEDAAISAQKTTELHRVFAATVLEFLPKKRGTE